MIDPLPRPSALPVTIVGGYLGAGKTTLVNHLLRHSGGRRIAVAVNEFGALPIDSDLIEGADGDILTLAGGCICCTFGSDLVAGLMDLSRRADTLDHIVIEASGVALPGAIAQSLSLVAGLSLDAIVVVVDAESVRTRASEVYMGDTITRQLADADLIVVNKTDLVEAVDLSALQAWLPSHAPTARIILADHAAVAGDVILGMAARPVVKARETIDAHVLSAFASESFTFDHACDVAHLATALASDAAALVRAKGFVRDHRHGWMTLQVVGRRTTVGPAPALDHLSGRLVCISNGRRFDRARISALIAACR